jgi:2-methylcitrate dehydratase PrpD
VRALRAKVSASVDAQLPEIAARVTVTLKNGRPLEKRVDRVVGSAENPMSDRDLESKVRGLAHGVLPEAQTAALIALTWRIGELADVAGFARAAALK